MMRKGMRFMSYILFRGKLDPSKTYNAFKAATTISNLITDEDDQERVDMLIARFYWKTIYSAAEAKNRSTNKIQAIPILPPAKGFWTWNKSFEIALDVASQFTEDDVHIVLSEDNHNITIGCLMQDMGKEEKEDMLAALDFSFGEDGKAQKREKQDKTAGAFTYESEKEDIDALIGEIDVTFSDYLREMMDAYSMNSTDLAEHSNLKKSTVSALRSGELFIPSKSEILAIGIAFQLDIDDMSKMLNIAGYCFSDSVPRDKIVKYYIDKGIYDLTRINKTLFVYDMPTLGVHKPLKPLNSQKKKQ